MEQCNDLFRHNEIHNYIWFCLDKSECHNTNYVVSSITRKIHQLHADISVEKQLELNEISRIIIKEDPFAASQSFALLCKELFSLSKSHEQCCGSMIVALYVCLQVNGNLLVNNHSNHIAALISTLATEFKNKYTELHSGWKTRKLSVLLILCTSLIAVYIKVSSNVYNNI